MRGGRTRWEARTALAVSMHGDLKGIGIVSPKLAMEEGQAFS
jgi:hypothetical protein